MPHYTRLRDLREDKDLNQTYVAELIYSTQSYYAQIEKGKAKLSFERAIILANFYGVSLDYIAGRTNDKRGIGYEAEHEQEPLTV